MELLKKKTRGGKNRLIYGRERERQQHTGRCVDANKQSVFLCQKGGMVGWGGGLFTGSAERCTGKRHQSCAGMIPRVC